MKKLFVSAICVLSASFAIAAPAKTTVPLIHVADLQKAMTDKNPVYIFDANNAGTRAKDGVIPGAKLLPSVSAYDTALLPQSKEARLVFHCANTECTASHTAAKRAMDAGYKHVEVMADGIQGWKKAGQKTEKGG